jgi:hypothetical protein
LVRKFAIQLIAGALLLSGSASFAAPTKVESWEKLDKRLKTQVYQLNVGIKFRLRGGFYAYLTDLSPKYKYPVFGTATDDKGFRVVGSGSTFPIKAVGSDRTYFLTNRHVVDSGEGIARECDRFFAAMRLHAQQTAGTQDPENRLRELLSIVNLCQKKDMSVQERTLYTSTVDGIWDSYENYLSLKADPQRVQYQKYSGMAGLQTEYADLRKL